MYVYMYFVCAHCITAHFITESNTDEELQQKLNIPQYQANIIWEIFVNMNYGFFGEYWQQLFKQFVNDYAYLGDKGLFNLVSNQNI